MNESLEKNFFPPETLRKEKTNPIQNETRILAKNLLEKLEQEDLKISDLRGMGIEVDFYISSGPGGQRKNKVETAVRLRYRPLGIEVGSSKEREQPRNLQIAIGRLRQRLEEIVKLEKPRIPTKLPESKKEKRRKEKERTSEKKKLRNPPPYF